MRDMIPCALNLPARSFRVLRAVVEAPKNEHHVLSVGDIVIFLAKKREHATPSYDEPVVELALNDLMHRGLLRHNRHYLASEAGRDLVQLTLRLDDDERFDRHRVWYSPEKKPVQIAA